MTHKHLRKIYSHNARFARQVADYERRAHALTKETAAVIYCYMRELLNDLNLFHTADFTDHYIDLLVIRFEVFLNEANKRNLRVDDQAAQTAAEICYKYSATVLMTRYFTDADFQADVDDTLFGGFHIGGYLGYGEIIAKRAFGRIADKLRGKML